jgi:uncharacterized membrane protein YeaQ/YmgE (transglycosylase-associated protein family)
MPAAALAAGARANDLKCNHGGATEMRRAEMPFTELYFKWQVLRGVSKILGVVGAWILVILYFVLASLFPAYQDQIAVGMFLALVGAVVLLVVSAVRTAFKNPKTSADIEKELGWTPNPPAGESWFRSDGMPKTYDRATGRWH